MPVSAVDESNLQTEPSASNLFEEASLPVRSEGSGPETLFFVHLGRQATKLWWNPAAQETTVIEAWLA